MRFIAGFLLLASLAVTFAYAQNNISQIQHIIVVVQENRTPDNLFGSDAFAQTRQLPGADLVQIGDCLNKPEKTVPLQSLALGSSCDPNHGHKLSWTRAYDNGMMDGACTNTVGGNCEPLQYPEYAYAQASDVTPYFQIAQQYGYANYMFQTNQGPSFPAHQFLLSGTSAPDYFNDPNSNCGTVPCYQWFAAENYSGSLYGCTATGAMIADVDPDGNEANAYLNGYPCYNHNSLVTLLDNANPKISWKYYAQRMNTATDLWTAPNAVSGICVPQQQPGNGGIVCSGSDWQNNVAGVFPNSPNYPNSFSPILTDLGADPQQQQCNLPAVSWVVPDGHWSDHAGLDGWAAGPSWVAAIVNAVGGYYYDASDQQHRTFCQNPDGSAMYWKNTIILVTWDDWGGWYDHILPWNSCGLNCGGYTNGPNSSSYVYGFRVPLLVVSAYTPKGYISGTCVAPGNCPNEKAPYIHDFGSILNFIEYAFGQNGQPLHLAGSPPASGISPSYSYADVFAPDGFVVCGANCPQPYALSDFFPSFTNPRTFTALTAPYKTECFIVPNKQNCNGENFTGPEDPDADDVDEQD